jgi:hypothetical protein
MTRNAYYIRLCLAAVVLSLVANDFVAKGPLRLAINVFAVVVLVAGFVLMYLLETGRSNWNGPKWGTVQLSSAKFRHVLIVVPMLCAMAIPVLILLNRRWGLSDAYIGFACGVLLGISLTVTFKLRSRGSDCAAIDGQTQQSGIE